MFDTTLVVVGNVLAAPEWRRLESSGSFVANFRIASTARRFDRENNSWIDGNSLRVRVSAWRRLAEGVISSIAVGDPVIVYGRLFTRDWKDDQGNNRISYEMEAYSIGHDLARGRSRFARNTPITAIDDAADDRVLGGEPLLPVPAEEAPVSFGDGVPTEDAPDFAEVEAAVPTEQSDEEIALEVERLTEEESATPTRRRRTRKEPVAA
ncbi:single-stranded DNA-binding protein [Actinoplanes bogorensis]|uniref:Single-stranded DNA-binding protein n=1 Tax=Paractinoplanes bogorensis TaxID=1610840 RepID=A0ABS5Z1C6_9ACTN|nr:single-stranded DNA-binding protein [Actinoplanes bogorensis]MBU2669504.1 single-stranded DNA-binding protein [Actinoplanes bogorensis]